MTNDLINELSTNFIEYAAAVNTDRAIPNAKDGLKPVAKRIIYGAYAGGRTSSKPHVKCAKIVGDVMGTFHPHGDSSIYEALVRLARPWIMRYPLIDFHGNMGNQAGDGPAAHRYTEARLAKLTEDGLLQGIKKKNVDFIPTYDESDEEPISLPSIFPNLLCNPNSGIGVAMACSWAPHNLIEVATAINDYIDGKEPMLPGPDFPTGGIIINKNDIPTIMKTGHGSVKIRAKYEINKQSIIFTEIPYGTSIEGLMSEIGEVSDSKEVEGIVNVRDESNKKGVRIVVDCDKNINPAGVVKKLFIKTNLQSSFSYNQVALVDKVPTELNLKQCIQIYIDYNIECLLKEVGYDLTKALERKEALEGLLKALEDIDNIITLIKSSESAAAAKLALIKKYDFTENQAKSILAMRLSSLAKLEGIELNKELQNLLNNIQQWQNIMCQKDLQINIIRERLSSIVKKYGDARKTELTQIDIKPEEKIIETITPEDVVVILSQGGIIKRVPVNSFKVQRKNGKGVKTKDEAIMSTISTNTIDNLFLFTKKGKMFKLIVDDIPAGTNTSKGVHVNTLIKIDADDEVMAITSLTHSDTAKYVVFFTKQGLMKKTLIEEYTKMKKGTGIAAIKINDNDSIVNVAFINEEQILVITKNGMSIRFESRFVNPVGRIAAGVKTIKLDENDEVIAGLPIHSETDEIAIISTTGYGKKVAIKDFVLQNRAGKGITIYKPSNIYGVVAGAIILKKESATEKILLIGQPNSICISSTDLPLLNRASFGNIILKSSIQSVVKL